MAKKKQRKTKRSASNTLRIIGGEWRSRKLSFPDALGLRPTPDRIRETLFNWLQGRVHGANCLDLFAGSGALGFEALSRGAKNIVFVEKASAVARQIEANLALLNSNAEVIESDALMFIAKQSHSFDIIFLDPPYRQGLLEKSLEAIQQQSLLKDTGLLYLEHESEESFDWSDYGLEVLKQANAGQVSCYLLTRVSNRLLKS